MHQAGKTNPSGFSERIVATVEQGAERFPSKSLIPRFGEAFPLAFASVDTDHPLNQLLRDSVLGLGYYSSRNIRVWRLHISGY